MSVMFEQISVQQHVVSVLTAFVSAVLRSHDSDLPRLVLSALLGSCLKYRFHISVLWFHFQLIAVVNQVSTLIGMHQVMCAGHFLYSHVREVSVRLALVGMN